VRLPGPCSTGDGGTAPSPGLNSDQSLTGDGDRTCAAIPGAIRDSRALTLLWVTLRWEQPPCLVHEFLLGPQAGIGEVAIRIAHHPLGTVIVVLDGDVNRHVRRLPQRLQCPPVPARGQRPMVTSGASETPPLVRLRQRDREQPGQQPD
jgi:hypothetical protein